MKEMAAGGRRRDRWKDNVSTYHAVTRLTLDRITVRLTCVKRPSTFVQKRGERQ
jgi:hypothetical protein